MFTDAYAKSSYDRVSIDKALGITKTTFVALMDPFRSKNICAIIIWRFEFSLMVGAVCVNHRSWLSQWSCMHLHYYQDVIL